MGSVYGGLREMGVCIVRVFFERGISGFVNGVEGECEGGRVVLWFGLKMGLDEKIWMYFSWIC